MRDSLAKKVAAEKWKGKRKQTVLHNSCRKFEKNFFSASGSSEDDNKDEDDNTVDGDDVMDPPKKTHKQNAKGGRF